MLKRPVPAVSALVTDQDKVLLIKRGAEPNRGLWSLPGGSIELGETVVDALVREIREETSLDVEPVELAGVHEVIARNPEGIQFHYVIITFRVRVVGGELAAASDAADAKWFRPEEIELLPTTEGLLERLKSMGC